MTNASTLNILLAEDDIDDRLLFQDALGEIPIHTHFKSVNDGEQLMHYLLTGQKELPSVIFLDLNMPRKDGFACLKEIKSSQKLKKLPVIIFSTSYDENIADELYNDGAHYYLVKPSGFSQLKITIERALRLIIKKNKSQPSKEHFFHPNMVA